jgi:hypothetical protein
VNCELESSPPRVLAYPIGLPEYEPQTLDTALYAGRTLRLLTEVPPGRFVVVTEVPAALPQDRRGAAYDLHVSVGDPALLSDSPAASLPLSPTDTDWSVAVSRPQAPAPSYLRLEAAGPVHVSTYSGGWYGPQSLAEVCTGVDPSGGCDVVGDSPVQAPPDATLRLPGALRPDGNARVFTRVQFHWPD